VESHSSSAGSSLSWRLTEHPGKTKTVYAVS